MLNRRLGAHQGVVYLSLAMLVILFSISIIACQSSPTVTEQWTPPYLQLHLCAGKAQLQWPDASERTTMEDQASITIEERCQIIADALEGALFCLGDGSTLELASEAVVDVQNPHTFPRLQITLQDGSLLFVAQEPSYEFIMPACSVTLLSVPSRIRVEINGETTRLAVEEGAVTCALETKTLTLPTCREMYVRPGEEPEVTEFCIASTVVPSPTPTLSPSSTPWELEPTATSFPLPTPTLTPRRVVPTPTRRRIVPTPTHTPVLPADTPPPPPPPPANTQPPPPTNTPAPPPPPPTNTPAPPPPPPTNTSAPPPPPDTPRPTPASPRPTSTPGLQ